MDAVKEFVNSLIVYDCAELTKTRIGGDGDGGYVLCEEICEVSDYLYSFGIGTDISFELDLVKRFPNVSVKLFDPCIDELPQQHPNFTFYKKGIGNGYGILKEVESESSILKMDIEWDEWDAFQQFDLRVLQKFAQIVVEFHIVHAEPRAGLTEYFQSFYERAFDLLNCGTFRYYTQVINKLNLFFYPFHIHANNSLPKIKVGGYSIPPLIEVSFINKFWQNGGVIPTTSVFPVEGLDKPNKTDRPDISNYYPLGG